MCNPLFIKEIELNISPTIKTLAQNDFSIELSCVSKEEIILILNKLPENKKKRTWSKFLNKASIILLTKPSKNIKERETTGQLSPS